MFIAGHHMTGIGLGTAQFAFREGTPEDAVQNKLSYAGPADLPTALACARRQVAYLAYSPFGGGLGHLAERSAGDRRAPCRLRAPRAARLAQGPVAGHPAARRRQPPRVHP